MRALWIALAVILVDQVTKTVVVQTMHLGQSIPLLGDWFKLTYTTNPGMAFGITFGPPGMMTAFAIIATILICFYLWKVRGAYAPYRWSLALVLAGALGNIIDRVFYGVVYRTGPIFTGEVVDFFHIDLWHGIVNWPLFGPKPLALWPIFNVADMAIVFGVAGIMITQKKFHEWQLQQAGLAAPDASEVSPVSVPITSGAPPTRG